MRGRIGRAAAQVLLAFALFPAAAGAVLYIDINAPGGKRLPLAVGDFVVVSGSPALSREIPKMLEADLELTRLFDLVPREAQLEKVVSGHFAGKRLDFPAWKTVGAEAVVIGKVERRGDQLAIEMRVYDATQGTLITGKRYSGAPREVPQIVHRFANEIMYAFTGVRGVFGTEIAFSARNGRAKEIYVVGMDGQGLRKVTGNRSFNLFPRWSPDGRWLSFTSFRTGVPVIYLHNPETGVEKEVVRAGDTKAPGGFSPDGDWLYYSVSSGGNSDIHRVRVVGGAMEKVAGGWGLEVSPTVSPDGRRIAFASDRSGVPQIYVKDLGSGEERRVSQPGVYATSPSWSPAGDRIAFTARAGGRFAVYAVGPDGTDLRPVSSAPGADCEDPSFSPDGRQLVYSHREKGYSSLKITSLDGRGERTLISGLGDIGSPAWSPAR